MLAMETLEEVRDDLEAARCSVCVAEEFVARTSVRHCDAVLANLREIERMVKEAKKEVTFK